MLIAEAEPRIYDLERGIVKQHAEYDNIVIMTEETWQDYIAEIKKLKQTEIVRCKDCYHYNKGENERESWEECNRTMKSTSADGFCSWAKMKGGNE